MRVDVRQPHLDFGDAMRIRRMFGLGEQARAFGISGKHPVDQTVVAARRLLRDVAQLRIARHRDRTIVGRDLAFQKTQQRRLAGAVAPDEPDLVAGRYSGGRRIENRPAFDTVGEIIDVQHAMSR